MRVVSFLILVFSTILTQTLSISKMTAYNLRVVDVAVYSTPLLSKTPSWQDPHTATQSVCDFTLTEFTKRKQYNNAYYSPPFYSHPHGYKLCTEWMLLVMGWVKILYRFFLI